MIRRMRLWVWWPCMSKDVSAYVNGCLLCVRKTTARPSSLRGSLSKPSPFQLISVDYVGPRHVAGEAWQILVVIDHASRFVMADATLSKSSSHVVSVLRDRWCSVFQAPMAVLSDRGSEFRSIEFRNYVCEELGTYHVLSSPYYPQGNAINEACHGALEGSIQCALRSGGERLPSVLRDAVLVHNATPHVATGVSPYCSLFGCEPVFPGWQQLAHSDAFERGGLSRGEARFKALVRDGLVRARRAAVPREAVSVGDWVVYPLGLHELKSVAKGTALPPKYSPTWSLPAKVEEVGPSTLKVRVIGTPRRLRDVARASCRVLRVQVPWSLAGLALKEIKFESPRYPRCAPVARTPVRPKRAWDELEKQAALVPDQALKCSKKPKKAVSVRSDVARGDDLVGGGVGV
jgi:transposase InsO family protein